MSIAHEYSLENISRVLGHVRLGQVLEKPMTGENWVLLKKCRDAYREILNGEVAFPTTGNEFVDSEEYAILKHKAAIADGFFECFEEIWNAIQENGKKYV